MTLTFPWWSHVTVMKTRVGNTRHRKWHGQAHCLCLHACLILFIVSTLYYFCCYQINIVITTLSSIPPVPYISPYRKKMEITTKQLYIYRAFLWVQNTLLRFMYGRVLFVYGIWNHISHFNNYHTLRMFLKLFHWEQLLFSIWKICFIFVFSIWPPTPSHLFSFLFF